MVTTAKVIKISKLDAARRQLQTAITLWFNDGDPVSTHTLAFAAYEIVHTISKKRDPNRRDLVFDSLVIKDEYRKEYNIWVKRHANFFKHGDRDGEAVIEFQPLLSEQFILFAILGLELCGERKNEEESAFVWWLHIHQPDLLTDKGRKFLADHFPINGVDQLRAIPKNEFLKAFKMARTMVGR